MHGTARNLRLSSSAVSAALRGLEEEKSPTLIARTTRRMDLNPIGKAVLTHVRDVQESAPCALKQGGGGWPRQGGIGAALVLAPGVEAEIARGELVQLFADYHVGAVAVALVGRDRHPSPASRV
ncbi:MAG: LysR family transcriptional regulator [Pseudomonadota bacterium]